MGDSQNYCPKALLGVVSDLKLARYFKNHIFIKLWCISLRYIGISKKN